MTVAGLATTALLLRQIGGDAAAFATAGPLLLAGLGGGMVTAPNITLALNATSPCPEPIWLSPGRPSHDHASAG
jgi:hypothetical protein